LDREPIPEGVADSQSPADYGWWPVLPVGRPPLMCADAYLVLDSFSQQRLSSGELAIQTPFPSLTDIQRKIRYDF
jgi:hypothetical protein